MINRQQPHVVVLPEDAANARLASGFLLDPSVISKRIQVLLPAGGWRRVLECFESDHVGEMDRYPHRFMVLLLDFDGDVDRLTYARRVIPDRFGARVFILGVRTEPEDLRRALGSYEIIGEALAKDCREETQTTWGHDLLRHNAGEIERLRQHVRPILFA
jgi:hypothetical protein